MVLNEFVVPVRWTDIDSYQHVSHMCYFTWMTEARAEWLRMLQTQLDIQLLYRFVVVDAQCNYQQSVFYPATIRLRQNLVALGNSSLCLDYQFYAEDVCVAMGSAKLVCIDTTTQKSTPLPSALREYLTSFHSSLS